MTNKDNKIIIGVVVAVLILMLLGIFGFGIRSYGMMGSYGFISFGWIVNILTIIFIILGIYWLIKNMNYNKWRK